jgi:hypothetical protein
MAFRRQLAASVDDRTALEGLHWELRVAERT